MLWNNFYKLRLCGDIKCIINHLLLKQVTIIEQDSKENDHFMAYLSLILFLTCTLLPISSALSVMCFNIQQ